ncbi:hypothetical protein AAG570_009717 [Ranatra chinensis]|uniref:Uncharacterized protein n=1 Tax=Ranatra chinensis TaxID=642074 RepID=A0ABD0Z2U9_9HEMI
MFYQNKKQETTEIGHKNNLHLAFGFEFVPLEKYYFVMSIMVGGWHACLISIGVEWRALCQCHGIRVLPPPAPLETRTAYRIRTVKVPSDVRLLRGLILPFVQDIMLFVFYRFGGCERRLCPRTGDEEEAAMSGHLAL